ncbi:MAG: hypothetical protein IIB87_04865 [Chloroflexi bacterium]|nr:hypothetical protein [Chloroflexota bacterium]
MEEYLKLTAALVVLHQDEIEGEIQVGPLQDALRDPAIDITTVAGPTQQQIRIRSLRAQIDITVESKRISIADLSEDVPARAGFVPTAQRVLALIGGQTGRAHGWNMDVTFRTDAATAGEEIANKFIKEEATAALSPTGLQSANVLAIYGRDQVRYTLKVEPRNRSLETATFYAHLNSHYDAPVPDENIAEAELQATADELSRALSGIFGD